MGRSKNYSLALLILLILAVPFTLGITMQGNLNMREYYNLTNVNYICSSITCYTLADFLAGSLTLEDIALNMGNWSADKPNYATLLSVATQLNDYVNNTKLDTYANKTYCDSLGNFSYENNTLVHVGSSNLVLSSCNNITGSNVDLCNVALSNSTYNATYDLWAYNQTTATAELYSSVWNSTYNATYDSKAGTGDCPNGEVVQNITTGNPECVVATSSTYNITYDLWAYNQTTATAELYSSVWNSTFNNTYDSKAGTGDCPNGQVVQNITNGVPECVVVTATSKNHLNYTKRVNGNNITLTFGV